MNKKQTKIDALTVADAEKRLERTEQALKAAKRELRSARNAERKRRSEERIAAEKRLKSHAGGFVEMVGLFRYVYEDDNVRDNNQDSLIANLIVGILLRASSELEKANVDSLYKLWIEGHKFREIDKSARVLPKVNPNIKELTERVLSIISGTEEEQNDNDTATKPEEGVV